MELQKRHSKRVTFSLACKRKTHQLWKGFKTQNQQARSSHKKEKRNINSTIPRKDTKFIRIMNPTAMNGELASSHKKVRLYLDGDSGGYILPPIPCMVTQSMGCLGEDQRRLSPPGTSRHRSQGTSPREDIVRISNEDIMNVSPQGIKVESNRTSVEGRHNVPLLCLASWFVANLS